MKIITGRLEIQGRRELIACTTRLGVFPAAAIFSLLKYISENNNFTIEFLNHKVGSRLSV